MSVVPQTVLKIPNAKINDVMPFVRTSLLDCPSFSLCRVCQEVIQKYSCHFIADLTDFVVIGICLA